MFKGNGDLKFRVKSVLSRNKLRKSLIAISKNNGFGFLFFKTLLFAKGILEVFVSQIFFLFGGVPRENLYPCFIGIGAQKSATTWLDKVLRLHPDICMPAGRKEVHFFGNNLWKGWSWYLWHFRYGADLIKGEITPAYSILDKDKIEYVCNNLGCVKIILLLRNPIDRAWSMACMDIVKHRSADFSSIKVQDFISHVRSRKSYQRGSYQSIIERWQKVFGKDNVYIGFYDDIVECPECLVEDVLDFIGVDSSKMDWGDHAFVNKENTTGYPMPDSVRDELVRIYSDDLINLHVALDNKWTQKWVDEYCEV